MKMKKFINKPENIVLELLEGFALASSGPDPAGRQQSGGADGAQGQRQGGVW